MKILKACLMVTLMSASVAAMAEGGGDTVMTQLEAARACAMASAHQSDNATTVASSQKATSGDVERSN